MESTVPVCDLCGETFDTEEDLQEHRDLVHQPTGRRGRAAGEDAEDTAA